MPIFVKLSDEDRINLFLNLKNKINCSWNIFYPKLQISRPMFFNYLSGRYAIPKNIFLELENIAKYKVNSCQEIIKSRYSKKEIKKPKMSSNLAEILGILNGDGHLSNIKYEICVVGSIMEEEYYHYMKKLFEDNFNMEFKLQTQDTTFKLRTYSILLSNFLSEIYGIPKGNKMGKLKIPKQVLLNDKYLISYIRGLYDTDGSFYIRRKKDPVIEISSADQRFLEEVKTTLIYLGFKVSKGTNKIFIYSKEQIKDFFNLIKPANPKHLKKYQNYLKIKI